MKKSVFYLILVIALLIVARGFKPSTNPSEFDIDSFSELPVQVGGRIKPLDSVARNTLLVLAGRQKVITPEGVKLSAIEWFMDLTMRPELADTYRVFKIELLIRAAVRAWSSRVARGVEIAGRVESGHRIEIVLHRAIAEAID